MFDRNSSRAGRNVRKRERSLDPKDHAELARRWGGRGLIRFVQGRLRYQDGTCRGRCNRHFRRRISCLLRGRRSARGPLPEAASVVVFTGHIGGRHLITCWGRLVHAWAARVCGRHPMMMFGGGYCRLSRKKVSRVDREQGRQSDLCPCRHRQEKQRRDRSPSHLLRVSQARHHWDVTQITVLRDPLRLATLWQEILKRRT